jgi:hypothetical protein
MKDEKTLPEANKNWTPECQAMYLDIKTEMERACVRLDVPMGELQKAILGRLEQDNAEARNYAATKAEKKPAGIVRRWLSSLFYQKN